MRAYQLPLIEIDRLIKLGEVERILSKVIYPSPSRPTIVEWIEDGTLDGKKIGRGQHWHIYKSSLDNLIIDMQPSKQKLAA